MLFEYQFRVFAHICSGLENPQTSLVSCPRGEKHACLATPPKKANLAICNSVSLRIALEEDKIK